MRGTQTAAAARPAARDLAESAAALATLLEQENAHLQAADFRRATALLDRKRLEMDAFAAAVATAPTAGAAPAAARAAAQRLADAAALNKRLLERSILVQGQVIAALARAIPTPPAAQGYRRGPPARPRGEAFALRSSA